MGEYLRLSEKRSYNFLLALVLLLLYEAFVFLFVDASELDQMNLIDRLFDELLVNSPVELWWLSLALMVTAVGFILVDLKEVDVWKPWVMGVMLLEALAWAGLLYLTLPLLTQEALSAAPLPQPAASLADVDSWLAHLGVAFGAGFYEEFFFRYLLVKLFMAVFALLLPVLPRPGRQILTVAVTALLFAATHLLVEDFNLYKFAYRTLLGLLMSALLVLRGFGITAWTHALYDVLVFWVYGH